MKLLENIRNYTSNGPYGNNKEILPAIAGAGGMALAHMIRRRKKKATGRNTNVRNTLNRVRKTTRDLQQKRAESNLQQKMSSSLGTRKAGIIRRPRLKKKKPY